VLAATARNVLTIVRGARTVSHRRDHPTHVLGLHSSNGYGRPPASTGRNSNRERPVKLKHWLRFLLYRDSTWHGQFSTLDPLLRGCQGDQRTVVDVGANDGFYSSNSYPFIARGWRALLVEPHPAAFQKAKQLHRKRKQVSLLNAACSDRNGELELLTYAEDDGGSHSFIGESAGGSKDPARAPGVSFRVKVHRLETLLDDFHIPCDFGLLTIDTEGHDFQVLRGANLTRHRPRVIITEKNPDDEEKFAHLRANGYHFHADLPYDTVWTVL
jgi:FkbM family methyltransferase